MSKENCGPQAQLGSTSRLDAQQTQTSNTTVDVQTNNDSSPQQVDNSDIQPRSDNTNDDVKSESGMSRSPARIRDSNKIHSMSKAPRPKASDGVVGISVGTGPYSPPLSPLKRIGKRKEASVNENDQSPVITHRIKDKSFKRMADGGTKKSVTHRNKIAQFSSEDLKNSKIDSGKSNHNSNQSPKSSYGIITGESVISSSDCNVSVIADDNGNHRVEYHNQLPSVSET